MVLAMCWCPLCRDYRGPRWSGIRLMVCSSRRVGVIARSSRASSNGRFPLGSKCWSRECAHTGPSPARSWSPGLSLIRRWWQTVAGLRDHSAVLCCIEPQHTARYWRAHRAATAPGRASRHTFAGFFSTPLCSLFVSLRCSQPRYMIREVWILFISKIF